MLPKQSEGQPEMLHQRGDIESNHRNVGTQTRPDETRRRQLERSRIYPFGALSARSALPGLTSDD